METRSRTWFRGSEETSILSTWQEQIAKAAEHPALRREIERKGYGLFLRFAGQYRTLRALPRRMRRATQRKWKQTLAGVALALALGAGPAAAAIIPAGVGGCTLVNAIIAANTDTATGLCPAGSGADTITLPPGSTQTLTNAAPLGGPYGPTGLPLITSVITIAGNGSMILRNPADPDKFRIIALNSSGTLILQNTTISGGLAEGVDPVGDGGGILNYGGSLTLTNTTVSGNSAYNVGAGDSEGGGIFSYAGPLTLSNSIVSGNSAYLGGGVFNGDTGTATVTNSTVSGNGAEFGGGMYNGSVFSNSASLTLTNSTVSGNSTNEAGAGIWNGGPLTLTNSTISGNSAGLTLSMVSRPRSEGYATRPASKS